MSKTAEEIVQSKRNGRMLLSINETIECMNEYASQRTVEALKEAAEGWISVEERLPDFSRKVLVYYYPRQPIMEGRTVTIDFRVDTKGINQQAVRLLCNNGFRVGEVTHWQTLPQPPKVKP